MAEKVNQDVREAAAAYYKAKHRYGKSTLDEIVAGQLDELDLVQAFARMKEAGRQQGLREAAEVARSLGYKQVDAGEPPYDGAPGIWGVTTFDNRKGNEEAIAAAITALMDGEVKK